jgi:glycine cleavage system H protein
MARTGDFVLPDELYYHAEDHLWARVEGNLVRVGLDAVAVASAQAISHIRLKPPGRTTPQNRPFGTMEAGKYVGPLRLPVGGKVVEVNESVLGDPGLVNRDPYGEGWMVLVEPEDLARDLALLMHGDPLQLWLEESVATWRAKGLLKN